MKNITPRFKLSINLNHKLSGTLEDKISLELNEQLNSLLWMGIWNQFNYHEIINP